MRKLSIILSVLVTVVVMGLFHVGWQYYDCRGGANRRRIEIRIEPGTTFNEVKKTLVESGVLERPTLFRWAAWITRRETAIQSGRYLFKRGESVASILDKLASGAVDYTRVVVPEGLMLREISSLFASAVDLDSTRFASLAADSSLLGELGIDAPSLEGYLFPDTYHFSWPLDERAAILRMVDRFNEVFDAPMRARADSLGLTPNEVVTLASIIQAEAVYDSEMPRISAVYHNRLVRGMRLEADPTVAYALGGVRRRLYYKDLRVRSPYNTYRIGGLPPGPICSPGRAALEAAVSPLTGSRDLYFVADGRGRHLFSRSLREHLMNKERVRDGEQAWMEDYIEEPETGIGETPPEERNAQ